MANNNFHFRKADVSVCIATSYPESREIDASAPILYDPLYSREQLAHAITIFLRQYFSEVVEVDIDDYHDTVAPFSIVSPSSADKFVTRLVSLITLQL